MKKWLRRIRGALGIGLTWAAAWALVGPLSFIALVGAMFGLDRVGMELLLGTVGFFTLSGFVSGAAFSVLLSLAEGRRTFDQMSLPRFAVWGALAGAATYGGALALFGAIWGLFALSMATIAALLGSGSAAGSLALARRSDQGRLLGGDPGGTAAELTEEETRAFPASSQ